MRRSISHKFLMHLRMLVFVSDCILAGFLLRDMGEWPACKTFVAVSWTLRFSALWKTIMRLWLPSSAEFHVASVVQRQLSFGE